MLGGRADGEGGRGRGGREAAVISSIKIVVAIAVYTSPLMALHYIWGWYCSTFCLLIVGVVCTVHFVGLSLVSLRTATDTGHCEKV